MTSHFNSDFTKKARQIEASPSDAVWLKIENRLLQERLEKHKSMQRYFIAAASFSTILIAGFLIYYTEIQTPNITIAQEISVENNSDYGYYDLKKLHQLSEAYKNL
ncbi:MAG: hypothetical protein R2774_06170 [Saprospiraceae bacterium]